MPAFFLSSTKGPPRKKIATKRGLKDGDDKEARLSRRRRMMERTEISSDEEDISVGGDDRISEASEGEYEIEDIARIKAKEYLQKLHESGKTEEEIGETLKEDAAVKAGTLRRQLADIAELRDEEEISHRGHRFTPLCVAISPDGRYIVSCGKESSIVKYGIKLRKIVGTIRRTKTGGEDQSAHHGHIFAVAISSDGKYIASGGHDAVLKIWDFATLAHIRDFKGHRAPITALCFQLKTNCLFSASRDRSVKLWDLDQMGMVDTMYGHQDAVVALSSLQKQRVVTAGRQDRSCRLWKVEDESQLLFNGYSACVSMDCVAMLNEEHFVSGSADGSLCVWSIWKKKPLTVRKLIHGVRAPGDPRWVICMSAMPFSDLVATGSDDGELKLWKVATDYKSVAHVFSYEVTGFINDIRFSVDGSLLAIAAGQEHREGRWWIAKNGDIVCKTILVAAKAAKTSALSFLTREGYLIAVTIGKERRVVDSFSSILRQASYDNLEVESDGEIITAENELDPSWSGEEEEGCSSRTGSSITFGNVAVTEDTVEKDARNQVIILPVHYGEEKQTEENSQNGNQSGPRHTSSDSDGEDEEEDA